MGVCGGCGTHAELVWDNACRECAKARIAPDTYAMEAVRSVLGGAVIAAREFASDGDVRRYMTDALDEAADNRRGCREHPDHDALWTIFRRLHGFAGVEFEDRCVFVLRDEPTRRILALTLAFRLHEAISERQSGWSAHLETLEEEADGIVGTARAMSSELADLADAVHRLTDDKTDLVVVPLSAESMVDALEDAVLHVRELVSDRRVAINARTLADLIASGERLITDLRERMASSSQAVAA